MKSFFEKIRNFFSIVWINIKSFFLKFGSSIKKIIVNFKLKIKTFFEKIILQKKEHQKNNLEKKLEKIRLKQLKKEEKDKEKAEKLRNRKEAAEKRNAQLKAKGPKILRKLLNIFDVIFDIAFSCGLIFYLRPEFLNFKGKNAFLTQYDFSSFKIGFFGKLSEIEEISNLTIFIIVCIFAFYLLYKIVFSLVSANGINKLVSILLTAITLVSIALVKDKFLIFLVFYILLFASFQSSCDQSFKTIGIKFLCVILLSLLAYIVILFIFDEFFRQCLILSFSEIKLPVKFF